MLTNNSLRTKSYYLGSCIIFLLLVFMYVSVYAQINTASDSPWKGREVFQQKGCSQCHAVHGGSGKGGPDLAKEKFYGTYLELAALMWNHFPSMSKRMQKTGYKFRELNNEEMSQLISYLAYFRYLGEPGNESQGKKLLKSKGCVTCHKFGGLGGNIGPDISAIRDYMSPIKLVESLWNHGPHMIEIFREYNVKRPQFKGNEIVHLAAAIRSFMSPERAPSSDFVFGDPVKGKALAEDKGCMRCHSVRGTGGSLGPDFAEIDFEYSVTQIAGKMWNHGPQMWNIMKQENIKFPIFAKGEIADVIAFIYGIKLLDMPGDISEGLRIVDKKNCLSCHSLQGKGAGISIDLSKLSNLDTPLEMITAMWNHAPAMQKLFQERKMKWQELSGRDMSNLYTYLCSLQQNVATEK